MTCIECINPHKREKERERESASKRKREKGRGRERKSHKYEGLAKAGKERLRNML